MDKYIKRIQTRVRRQGRKVTKQNCRDVYQQVVNTLESPTDTEINTVVETLLQENHPISSPETLDITPETHPDIWQTLSPPNAESALISYLGGDKAEGRGQKAEGSKEKEAKLKRG